MTVRVALVGALVAGLLGPAPALAQKSKDCPQPSASPGTASRPAAPAQITGEVTKVDRSSNMVTMRLSDGSTQQFRASDETLADLKVGDRIEAKKRTPDC
jgi:hypothetical protein